MLAPLLAAQAVEKSGRLMAYVGTYTSPLKNMKATQVDLPPGNGRGIHWFEVDRASGALTPAGVYEMGTSPSCLAFNADTAQTILWNGWCGLNDADKSTIQVRNGCFGGQYQNIGDFSLLEFIVHSA